MTKREFCYTKAFNKNNDLFVVFICHPRVFSGTQKRGMTKFSATHPQPPPKRGIMKMFK
jgi:hypothetical protein